MFTYYRGGKILRNLIIRGEASQQNENKTRTELRARDGSALANMWKTQDCLRHKINKSDQISSWGNSSDFVG